MEEARACRPGLLRSSVPATARTDAETVTLHAVPVGVEQPEVGLCGGPGEAARDPQITLARPTPGRYPRPCPRPLRLNRRP